MKTIALTLLAAGLGFAQSGSAPAPAKQSAKDKAKPAPVAKNKKPAPPSRPAAEPPPKPQPPLQVIPAGATMIEPNLYRYTDAGGKTWNYKKTPFGISRWEETTAPAPPAASPGDQSQAASSSLSKSDPVTVTDLGDSYRFERKTPFGGSSWVRKKSELTDDEKFLTGQQPAAEQNQANTKPAGN